MVYPHKHEPRHSVSDSLLHNVKPSRYGQRPHRTVPPGIEGISVWHPPVSQIRSAFSLPGDRAACSVQLSAAPAPAATLSAQCCLSRPPQCAILSPRFSLPDGVTANRGALSAPPPRPPALQPGAQIAVIVQRRESFHCGDQRVHIVAKQMHIAAFPFSRLPGQPGD